MKIKRIGLVNDLSKVLPGISTGTSTIEGCDTVLFHEGNIYTYNTMISVMTKDSQNTGLSGVVNAKDFYDCLVKLPSEEIDVKSVKGKWILTDGKIEVTVNLLDMIDLGRFEALKSEEPWTEINGDELTDSIRMTIIKKNKPNFDGVYFDGKLVISTNQIIINKCDGNNDYPTSFVSRNCCEEIIKWKGFTAMRLTKMWLQFKVEDTIFSVRTLNTDDFPLERTNMAYNKISAFNKVCDIELTEKFFRSCGRATAFSNKIEDAYVVSVKFGKETSITSSKTSGSYSEVIDDVVVDHEDFVVNFDVEILEILNQFFHQISVLEHEGKFFIVAHNDRCIKVFSSIKMAS